ncbi:hypothetical protein ACFXPS_34870 [Nocardia sp. NPDC059091]|uniref:hypothetical protein n=1 Tax=unclassified Nocardia TaxID=2637762 RepID=UPI0036A45C7D
MGELAVAPSIVIKYADRVEQMSLTVVRAPAAGSAHFHGVPGTTFTGANVAAALRITPGSGLHGCAPVPAVVAAGVRVVVTAVGSPARAAVLAAGLGRAPDPPLSPHPAAPQASTSAASPIPTFRTTSPTFRTTSSLRSTTPTSPQRDTARVPLPRKSFPPRGGRLTLFTLRSV